MSNDKPSVLVSAVSRDLVIETIYSPDTTSTAFVLAEGTSVREISDLTYNGKTYIPVRPGNNLLKHRAILLPSGVEEYGGTVALVREIEAYIRRYVSLPESAIPLCASYILLSWVYDAFNELPYLRFRGDYGTGKTRALLVIGSLCYKGFFASGASTVSPIFHTLNTFRGTLIFDEADFRFSDEKAELVKILNNGNVKGFPVLRTQMTAQKEFDPAAFFIFGPKIVAMRRTYDDRALESRFLTIEMEPGHADGIPINLPASQAREADVLRNKLLMYRLRNRQAAAIDALLLDPSLEPRMNQILLPLLSVAPTDAIRAMVKEAARKLQAGIISERSVSTEGQVLAVLAGLLKGDKTQTTLADITKAFSAAHGGDYERPITPRWVGSKLRRMGVLLYKSHGEPALMPGQEERIGALCGRYGIGRP